MNITLANMKNEAAKAAKNAEKAAAKKKKQDMKTIWTRVLVIALALLFILAGFVSLIRVF